MLTEPTYGLSTHYIGDEGEQYFAFQNSIGQIGGRINARKFARYIRPSDCVLDFGCGGGFTLQNLSCAKRIGVEINPAARKVAAQNGLEVCGSVTEVADQIADVVISNHALEHVPFPIQALRELRTKLKAGGVLVLVLPIDDWRTQRKYDPADINHHLHTWTPQLLGHTLREAGFVPAHIDIRVLTHAWSPGTDRWFGRLPLPVFDLICALHALALKRRQLIALCRNSD